MRKIIKIVSKTPNRLVAEFFMGNVCNYKCSYCFPGSNEGTHRWPDYDLAITNIEKLLNFYVEKGHKETIDFKIIGGEPTLWPQLKDFVVYLKSKFDIKISMSTNGSRTVRYWEEISPYFDDIQISVHHEFVDLEHVVKVADAIYKTNQTVLTMNVLMDPGHWDKCVSVVDYLKANGEPWMLSLMNVQYDGLTKYTELQEQYMKVKNIRMPPMEWVEGLIAKGKLNKDRNINKSIATFDNGEQLEVDGYYLIANKLHNFLGYKCNLGVDRFFIDKTGRVSGAYGCVIFDDELNINNDNFDEVLSVAEIKQITCQKTVCPCSTEARLTKEL